MLRDDESIRRLLVHLGWSVRVVGEGSGPLDVTSILASRGDLRA